MCEDSALRPLISNAFSFYASLDLYHEDPHSIRHNFRGVGDATHGQHNRMRAPGSIGAASYPARVFKGMRMAGQMGNKRVKVTNLQVMKVFPEKNLLVVKGAIPGPKNSYVIVEK